MQEWTDGSHGASEMLKPVHAARGETQQASSPGDEKHMRSGWKVSTSEWEMPHACSSKDIHGPGPKWHCCQWLQE